MSEINEHELASDRRNGFLNQFTYHNPTLPNQATTEMQINEFVLVGNSRSQVQLVSGHTI